MYKGSEFFGEVSVAGEGFVLHGYSITSRKIVSNGKLTLRVCNLARDNRMHEELSRSGSRAFFTIDT